MSECQDLMAQRHTMDRIACALERIADAMEALPQHDEHEQGDQAAPMPERYLDGTLIE